MNGAARIFTYDGWKPILEWDGAGNWLALNIYGAGSDEILGRYDSVGRVLIYKHDKQGNVVALLGSDGSVIEKYSYDAFGKPTVTDNWGNVRADSIHENRFMFTGREWIKELGIYDYRNRFYHPGLGRFLQTDPTGFGAGDMNLFRYCDDDPVDRSDPTGLDSDVFLYREYADRDAPGRYVIVNDKHKQIYSGPANQNPFYANTHGVRTGDYTLQPKGEKWGKGTYPSDQPAITGNAQGLKPGQPNSSYRAPALVHKALPFGTGPDSQGCVTVAQDAVDKTKEVMAQDRKSGGVTRFHIREPVSDPVTTRRGGSREGGPSSSNDGLGAGEAGNNNSDISSQLNLSLSNYLMGTGDNSGEGVHPRGPR